MPWGFPDSILREKIGGNKFFAGKKSSFFKNLCFQKPLMCYGRDLVTCTMTAIIPCGPTKNYLRSAIFGSRRRKGQKCLSSGKKHFFEKLFFHPPRRSLKNDLITCTITVAISCGPLKNVPLGFSCSMRRKLGRDKNFVGKRFFYKHLFFQHPLRCYGNVHITCTMIVIIPCGA